MKIDTIYIIELAKRINCFDFDLGAHKLQKIKTSGPHLKKKTTTWDPQMING